MTKNSLSNQLKELTFSSKNRTLIARLRDRIDDIEAAIASGVSQSAIVETLVQNGIDISLATFNSTLRRIRESQRRGKPSAETSTRRSKPEIKVEDIKDQSEVATGQIGTHNPADLDAIIGSRVDLDALAKIGKKKRV